MTSRQNRLSEADSICTLTRARASQGQVGVAGSRAVWWSLMAAFMVAGEEPRRAAAALGRAWLLALSLSRHSLSRSLAEQRSTHTAPRHIICTPHHQLIPQPHTIPTGALLQTHPTQQLSWTTVD